MALTDLVIAVGHDLIEYSPKKWNPDGSLPIPHIATLRVEIDSNSIPQVEVVGDISDSLPELLRHSDCAGRLDPYLQSNIHADHKRYAQDQSHPIKPQNLRPATGTWARGYWHFGCRGSQ